MLQNTVTVAISFIVRVFKQLSFIMLFPTLQDQLTKDNFIPFFQVLQSYGITLRECIHGNGSQVPVQVQPDWFKGSNSEYADTMKNYIRNHEIMIGACIK